MEAEDLTFEDGKLVSIKIDGQKYVGSMEKEIDPVKELVSGCSLKLSVALMNPYSDDRNTHVNRNTHISNEELVLTGSRKQIASLWSSYITDITYNGKSILADLREAVAKKQIEKYSKWVKQELKFADSENDMDWLNANVYKPRDDDAEYEYRYQEAGGQESASRVMMGWDFCVKDGKLFSGDGEPVTRFRLY